jgi:hypothetical protein
MFITILGNVVFEVLQTVAGMTAASHESGTNDGGGCCTDRSDRDLFAIDALEESHEVGGDALGFPTIAARKDQYSHVFHVDLVYVVRNSSGYAPHRQDGTPAKSKHAHFKTAVPAQLGKRMSGLPISKAFEGQEMNRLCRHIVLDPAGYQNAVQFTTRAVAANDVNVGP